LSGDSELAQAYELEAQMRPRHDYRVGRVVLATRKLATLAGHKLAAGGNEGGLDELPVREATGQLV